MFCEKCMMEVLRKKKPSANLVCARCRKPLIAFEVVEMRPVELARAAFKGQR